MPGPTVADITDAIHLTRDRALRALTEALAEPDAALPLPPANLEAHFGGETWEERQGSFAAAALLAGRADEAFRARLLAAADVALEDRESRVRLAAVDALEAVARADGPAVYEKLRERLFQLIRDNYERTEAPENPSKHTDLRHDTEGWKFLETSTKALRALIVGCGEAFSPHVTHEVLDVVFGSLSHTNRFVRETGFFCVGAICHAVTTDRLVEFGERLAKALAGGLGDNWSQVRMAASVATRDLMTKLALDERSKFYPILIPRMCLNRYYIAEGVRLYSQKTWKLTVGDQGRALLARYATETVDFYLAQTESDNHGVREAAYQCIAELAVKGERDSVSPHVPRLLSALINGFKDAAWPVRDAACNASGNFVGAFPEESRASVDELYAFLFKHLCDNIWSVREDAAVALGKVVEAYGDDAFAKVLAKVKELLPKVEEQPKQSIKNEALSNETKFGVAHEKHAHDNDVALHTNQQTFSCGSLAPRLKRGAGCMDHSFSRPAQPWEMTDGAIYMVRELASIKPDAVAALLPDIIEIAGKPSDCFLHFPNLLETIWKQMPAICAAIGYGKTVKVYPDMVRPLVATLQCGHQLATAAAGYCLTELRLQLGGDEFDAHLVPGVKDTIYASPFFEKKKRGRKGPRAAAAPGAAAPEDGSL